jgi:HEAT repeat protein
VDATLKRVVGLIAEADVETRCAALLVLSHIGAADPVVVRAVGEALGGRNAVVRDFAVAYLERVRPRDGLRYLLPLLDNAEEALRKRAVTILANYGPRAVAAVTELVNDAPGGRLNAIIDLCARVRSNAAFDLLFRLLAGKDFDANRTACDAVISVVLTADARARADLFARVEALMDNAVHRPALIAAAKLFGAIGDPKARKQLLSLLDKEQPQAVRTHALGALQHCLRGQKLSAGEIEQLLPLLDEDDEAGILRPTVHLLDEQRLGRDYLPQLNRLAESPQPLVKRFAVRKLGGVESGEVIKTLIGYLTDASYARRDQATASLKKMPAARGTLMKEFLVCEDERKAWALADILLVHEREWKRRTLETLWAGLVDTLQSRNDRLYTAYFHLLEGLAPDFLATNVRDRAQRLRKGKDFAGVAKWLGLLKDSPALDAEASYLLALAELKSHPHALSGLPRRHDLMLELLHGLATSTFPLAERLRKERALEPDELLYVSFNLAEGDPEEKAVARELLQHLASKYGRSKVGKAAKNKLGLLSGRESTAL